MDGLRVGGPIAGAELTIVSGANINAHVTSDPAGRYVFSSLESGRFIVTIVARGYVSTTPAIDLYRDTEANFALKPR
jgi:hypothetical protein